MKLKKILGLALGMVFAASLAVSASAGTLKGLEVTNRFGDFHGVDIVLADFIPAVENGDQGTYVVEALVYPLDDFSIAGAAFKILTQGGDTPPEYVRFSTRDPITVETRFTTTASGDDPNSGEIPAEALAAAAESGQLLRFCTQSDMNGFIIKGLTVTHNLDGVSTVVYNLNDELQFMNVGDVIEDNMAGRFTVRSGTPLVKVVENEVDDEKFNTPSVMVYVAPPETEAPVEEEPEEEVADETEAVAETTTVTAETTTTEATEDASDNGGLVVGIIIAAAAVVVIIVIVVVVKNKK